MYRKEDSAEVKKQLSGFYALMAVITLVSFALLAWLGRAGIQWLGYIIALLWFGIVYFLWEMYGVRFYRYSRFLKEMETGRQRVFKGTVLNIDDSIFLQNEVECARIECSIADSPEETRILYLDREKWPIDIKQGDHVEFQVYGNIIKEYAVL